MYDAISILIDSWNIRGYYILNTIIWYILDKPLLGEHMNRLHYVLIVLCLHILHNALYIPIMVDYFLLTLCIGDITILFQCFI
jgi:hypothetical protein